MRPIKGGGKNVRWLTIFGIVVAMSSFAVIGGGKIGEALIAGLIAGGITPKDIHVTTKEENRREYLRDTYQVVPFDDNAIASDGVDLVFICVKPQTVLEVVNEIADTVDNNDATAVVSMAAGVNISSIEEELAAGTPVIRVMPNTPMLIGKGMSVIAPGRFVTPEQLETVAQLLATVGAVEIIDESQIDAATALSGSSPAYLFLMVEAMIDAGVNLGLSRDVAKDLSVNAFYGAAAMLKETGEEPAVLRANVSSPGGSTVAAIRIFEEAGMRGAFYGATEACAKRAKELG